MMIKSILVPATGNDTDAELFASALAVARPLAAHIDFLHVRLDAAGSRPPFRRKSAAGGWSRI
jgi:hypothetical protein